MLDKDIRLTLKHVDNLKVKVNKMELRHKRVSWTYALERIELIMNNLNKESSEWK
jgi:hypothetical protein